MGYSTDFEGSFDVSPSLAEKYIDCLRLFNQTRRMTIDEEIACCIRIKSQPELSKANFPAHDDWCQWTVNDNLKIAWDGGEKFYNYVDWLEYIMKHFLVPWGYTLNGTVTWQGESDKDVGKIMISDNIITVESPQQRKVIDLRVKPKVFDEPFNLLQKLK